MNTPNDSQDDNSLDASELLDFELIAKSQPEKSQGIWLWVVMILILAGGGWAAWLYMQDQETEVAQLGGVPIILAPQFKLKEKPADPGGMKVPDRDKRVYDQMAGKDNTTGVERLLPPAEKPLEPPKAPPKILEKAPEPVVKKVEAVTAKVVAPPPPPPPPVEKKAVAKVVAKIAPAATAKSGYRVQLSAVRTEQAAKAEWARLSKKHKDVLGALIPVIQRADLGERGIFYRVRGGWLPNRAAAKAICDALKKRNTGCLIVKP